ncbi:hypothetical protein [Nocardia nova]|uniref:hypothetical protein n=1 Tax=Nocardia nova TaxID=37330 RepID=UPI0018963C45|nr:hypothetical protein [Nocardia nova]MBF6149815.1 hypothetical protein [Nocardia nova]MDN2497334.1 hypothetical protein [Nocardia nova]
MPPRVRDALRREVSGALSRGQPVTGIPVVNDGGDTVIGWLTHGAVLGALHDGAAADRARAARVQSGPADADAARTVSGGRQS